MQRALLIEVDFETEWRAGGINPRTDQHLICPPSHGWQNLDSVPGLEIRLITDGRDIKKYQGIKGVTILEGTDAINAAIQTNIPMVRYGIQSEYLLREDMKEKGISLGIFQGMTRKEMAEEAHRRGLLGVFERKTKLLE